jgi:hypothetical protein
MARSAVAAPHPQVAQQHEALPTIEAAGFGASVDAYVWECDPDPAVQRMRLWCLSLLGQQQAVKALWARLVRGEIATLRNSVSGQVRFCALAPEGPRQWRLFTATLPASAGYQAVLIPEAARYTGERADFLLLPRWDAEAAELHYRFLNCRADLPLYPAWAAWLWERALRTGEALPLEAHGLLAFRCVPSPRALAADLSQAVRAGQLAAG